jgi:pimeloyl-ACP methyl ester carboxylesterase
MSTFGLIPGACHGAWCFDLLVPELEARGHSAVAIDLPCDDVSAGFDRYAQVAVEALGGAGDDVVLVAHSLGAHTSPRVARMRPVRSLVFVCGVLPPRSGERRDDEPPMEVEGTFGGLRTDDQGRFSFPKEADAISAFYHDCPPELAAWAASKLRPQSTTPHRVIDEPFDWPELPCASIVCAEDRVARAEWGRWAARERLPGATVIDLPGSHSPFLSRPEVLADVLVSLV